MAALSFCSVEFRPLERLLLLDPFAIPSAASRNLLFAGTSIAVSRGLDP
jgi:hypothetical protein